MIKRGKEEADNLGNFLPLFQKKLKDPSQGKSQNIDYSNRKKQTSAMPIESMTEFEDMHIV